MQTCFLQYLAVYDKPHWDCLQFKKAKMLLLKAQFFRINTIIWSKLASNIIIIIHTKFFYMLLLHVVLIAIRSHDVSDDHMIITWLWLSHSTWVWHTGVTCSGHVTCPNRPNIPHLHHVVSKKTIVESQLYKTIQFVVNKTLCDAM